MVNETILYTSSMNRLIESVNGIQTGGINMKKEIMVTLAINNEWDTPQPNNECYFDNLKTAKENGVILCKQYNASAFCARLLTSNFGHYRTLGYFNTNGEYLR